MQDSLVRYDESCSPQDSASCLPGIDAEQHRLLSGSGESGKSTIVKQMKIIHQNGYSTEELSMYRLTIYKNVIDCAKALIGAMRQFEIEPEIPGNRAACDYLMTYSVDPDPEKPLHARVGQAVTALWRDPCIRKVFEHSNEFYLMDSAP
jgi:guanine nucleotide-binding protein G(i) subunit alpha